MNAAAAGAGSASARTAPLALADEAHALLKAEHIVRRTAGDVGVALLGRVATRREGRVVRPESARHVGLQKTHRRGMMKELLHRRDVMAQLLENRGELMVIGSLSSVSDITSAGDHDLNFPMWGAMGGGAMVGLGLALAQPKRKTPVVTGDGEMLMGIGALATIAVMKPNNLYVVVLDNEHYGETGMQEGHTGHGVDLAGMAKAAGFLHALSVDEQKGVARLRRMIYKGDGPLFAQVKIEAEKLPMVLPPRDGCFIKNRFRIAVLGPNAVYDE